ncbi:lactate racemase domain-containing protein [Porphyromonadaceae bacterium]
MNESDNLKLTELIEAWVAEKNPRGTSLLVITPDATRSCPLAEIVKTLQTKLRSRFDQIDYLVALGTHKLMEPKEIRRLYGLDAEGADEAFQGSHFFNHRWDMDDTLIRVGCLSGAELSELTDGQLQEDIDILINRIVFDYEKILVISPVFPHEVVGFSGGVKYFFPGVSGGDFVQKFHWLGGLLGASSIIGQKDTVTRRLIEKATKFLDLNVQYLTLVIAHDESIAACYLGSYPEAWSKAADTSAMVNVVRHPKQFQTVIGLAPKMFTEIWTAGKVMYKLERMVAPGGQLIIYGPHIETFSHTWGKWIMKVGYHTKDYLLAHPELMDGVPPGIFAQSCYVKGMGRYINGIECPRIDVTLCTGISESICRSVNLSYIDPRDFDVDLYRGRETEGYLVIDNAGEVLHIPDEEIPW